MSQDILINSGLVASGSIDGVLSGKNFNRAIRGWKILMEALERLRFQSLIQEKPQFLCRLASFSIQWWMHFLMVNLWITLEVQKYKMCLLSIPIRTRIK